MAQAFLHAFYLLAALAAALAFYLATPHQRLRPGAAARAGRLRWIGAGCSVLSAIAAIAALGTTAGLFAALTALMLGAVALPYFDAWLALREERRHVG